MHWDTLKQGNHSTVRGDGGSRVGEVRAGTTSPMPEHQSPLVQPQAYRLYERVTDSLIMAIPPTIF